MKINNLRRGGVILLLSLLLNIALLVAVVIGEHYGHAYHAALVRRGIVAYEDKKTGGYWDRVGWTNTLEKMNIECDAAFFGNSITRGSDFQQFFPDLSIVNLGLPGDNLLGMYYRINMVKAVNPKKVFIMAGTNDLFHCSVEQYSSRYEALLVTLRDSIPNAKVYIESVLPMNHKLSPNAPSHDKITSANSTIKQLAGKYGCTFIDLYSLYVQDGDLPKDLTREGIHLKPEAYRIWADAIKDYIYE